MNRRTNDSRRRAFSLVGLLVTMVCIVILFAIGMSAMNKAVTGEGSASQGTVRSFEDKLALYTIYTSLAANAPDHRGRFITPSDVSGRGDVAENTTANLYSAMIMQHYVEPKSLISGNEYSGWVIPDEDYDYQAYDPRGGVYWDPTFEADLEDYSNVSFAHVPLFGERFDRHWCDSMSSGFPLVGNRGPRDGIDDPDSLTYGRSGRWGGHAVFGDGHVDFFETFTPPGVLFDRDGQRYADNIFKVEDGPAGRDAILSFTKKMTAQGPELQWD
jgi:hypothetical protein